ncbi:phenylacetic acid degradation operon negative regulatory protein [Conyzicola nivalis]|uniref:Phenylacetic acid degradation operon negative regulatory protein n=1 Tax=Conyzicola nivalis TaxID=1477021 RepID=A0ABV2QRH0_9MICO
MSAIPVVLDDMDPRPGSATSLLRTIVGLYFRRVDGWMSTARLIALMQALDVPEPATRTALARMKKKGLLVSRAVDGATGYALGEGAAEMLQKGDRRIFSPRNMGADDPWCLISFSVPEHQRPLRHQLRRRLHWIGAGIVTPALWICPGFLSDEVEDIVDEVGARGYVTLFTAGRPRVAGDLRTAVAGWWDLAALEELHRGFIAEASASVADDTVADDAVAPGVAFARYIRGVDSWRSIPYLDPGLPLDLLPADWPGARSAGIFAAISGRYADAGWQFVRTAA